MATSWTNTSKSSSPSWSAGSVGALVSFLLKEDGGILNLESGSAILLEAVGTFDNQSKNTTSWTNQSKS